MRLVPTERGYDPALDSVILKNDAERVMYELIYLDEPETLVLTEGVRVENEGKCHVSTQLEF